jgi:uncharacterized protein (DUF2267 family)
VGAQVGAADTEEARRAVEAVIAAVAASLEEPDRDRLAAVLPGSLRSATEMQGEAPRPDSGAALVSAVSAGSGFPAERARFYTQAVLSTLAGSEPDVASVLARRLPDGEDLFSPIDQGVPPRFSYERFEEQSPDAYERVILDALIGDPTPFIRADEVGRSWRIVDP